MPKIVELDWKELNAILQFGVSSTQAAQVMGISADFIENKIREVHNMTFTEYRAAKEGKVKLLLKQKAITMGLAGNAAMLKYSLANMCGWSDRVDTALSGEATIKIETDEQGL
jgi:hypothetical protein